MTTPHPRARRAPGHATVATVDVAPTAAALVGFPAPEDLDGVDRSDALAQTRSPA